MQPVLIRGRVDHIDGATGELLHRYTTAHEPGGVRPVPVPDAPGGAATAPTHPVPARPGSTTTDRAMPPFLTLGTASAVRQGQRSLQQPA
jgi:hypothetical protein